MWSVGLVFAGAMLIIGAPVESTSRVPQGSWRDGFKAAHRRALQFNNWDDLADWARKYGDEPTTGKMSNSTDLMGSRHDYRDTFEAGYRDGQISIQLEMLFIGRHNEGGTDHFLRMTKEWIKMQNLDEIIPPGHF